MSAARLLARLRRARFVTLPAAKSPAPSTDTVDELRRLRLLLDKLAESRRAVSAWKHVSDATRARILNANAQSAAWAEKRIAELGGTAAKAPAVTVLR